MIPINKNLKTLRFVLAFTEKLYTFAPEKRQFFDVRLSLIINKRSTRAKQRFNQTAYRIS